MRATEQRAGLALLILAIATACTPAPASTDTPVPSPPLTASGSPSAAASTPSPSLSASATSPATPSLSPIPTATSSPSTAPTVAPTPSPSPTLAPSAAIIEVIAGGGSATPGDGGLATDAHLGRLTGLAFAADGTIWFVDSNAGTVRTITSDGLIHTVAGGLSAPQGMCLNANGKPYIAERGTYRVVTIDSGGSIKAVAGSSLQSGFSGDGGLAKRARLSQPYDVACDAAGNVYIADTGNQRVRRIDAETLVITTIAGDGTDDFGGDGGQATAAQLSSPEALAVDPADTVLFIGDYGDSHLRRVDLATGTITTVAGSGVGSVAYNPLLTGLQVAPTRLVAIARDAAGNVYLPVFFTDRGQIIMRLDPAGNLTAVAGGGTTLEAGGPATDFRLPAIEVIKIEPLTGALLLGANDGRLFRVAGVATP